MTSTVNRRQPATATTSDPVILASNVSKTFAHEGVQQHVLTNLDLAIRTGEYAVVMGPSGAGKSTLLHVLSGMDAPTLGRVRVSDTEIADLSPRALTEFRRHHCGFVFQQIQLLDALSVLDNVLAVGLLADRNRRRVVTRARELLARVGIDEATQRKFPGMLSGGEAQRVAVVRALVNEPDVVFADEPTGQLNSEFSRAVLDLLSQVNAGGQTVLMVTHDVRSALRGDRVLYLRDGAIRGECVLGRRAPSGNHTAYDLVADDERRLTRLTGFLDEMGW
ncbi:MAG: ABC transporter ATP-binding protein [Micrococcales bacterium]|nr:ABC transporter ATP-binding protein [Micrococcales bacterium]